MVIVVIAILGLLVVHAAGKVTATATIAAGGDPNSLPPDTSVAPTGNAQSPSPATWGGAPGVRSAWQIKVNTNGHYTSVAPTGMVSYHPDMPGVPLPTVPAKQSNGYDAVPASTKSLSVNRIPTRTHGGPASNLGGTKL